jgi:hypothetical protein
LHPLLQFRFPWAWKGQWVVLQTGNIKQFDEPLVWHSGFGACKPLVLIKNRW